MKYKFRAECFDDAMEFFRASEAKEIDVTISSQMPDITATFDSAKDREALIKIASGLMDCHVIEDTLHYEPLYTGERF